MSIIHVNQIKAQLINTFHGKIDMGSIDPEHSTYEEVLLSRSLAAYALMHYANITEHIAAASITDGGDDNGLDSVYYDEYEKILYLGQSKWIKDGTGEINNGDVKKFIAGVKDLLDFKLDRFNPKVNLKTNQIK